MKVVLLSPPYLPYYMRNARCDFVSLSGTQWYPILLGYCGAWLEKHGHTVCLIDAPVRRWSFATVIKKTMAFRPDWIVLYTGRLSEDSDVAFGERLMSMTGAPVVLAGPFASARPLVTLGKCQNIRYLIKGEFETAAQELIDGKDPKTIGNLVYVDNGMVQENPLRPPLSREQLDAIPFVSAFFKNHVRINKYRALSEPFPFMDILTGRGCAWGRCTYCLWVHSFVRGPSYTSRSAGNVIEELSFIEKDMPRIRSIMIQDDTLTEERAQELSEAKLRAGIRLLWSCYVRGNLPFGVLALMKRAGCLNIHVGFESGSDEILREVRKGISRDRMTEFARDAKRAGLSIHGDFAIGFPGETAQTVQETTIWACALRPDTVQFQLMIPFPGTPFYEQLEKKKWLKDGLPDYPNLRSHEMEILAKKAYRKFYFNRLYLKQILMHPWRLAASRLKVYWRALPALFWKRYIR